MSFDHSQGHTANAILINNKEFKTYLIDEEDEAKKTHLISCIEIFHSNEEAFNLLNFSKKLADTDFSFSIKLNIAWQIGLNIQKDPSANEIRTQMHIMMFEKECAHKSDFIEYLYNSRICISDEEKVLLLTLVHGLIA